MTEKNIYLLIFGLLKKFKGYAISTLIAAFLLALSEPLVIIFLPDFSNSTGSSGFDFNYLIFLSLLYLLAPFSRTVYSYISYRITSQISVELSKLRMNSYLRFEYQMYHEYDVNILSAESNIHMKTLILGTLLPFFRSVYSCFALVFVSLTVVTTIGFKIVFILLIPLSIYYLILSLIRKSLSTTGASLYRLENHMSVILPGFFTNLPRLIQSSAYDKEYSYLYGLQKKLITNYNKVKFLSHIGSSLNEVLLITTLATVYFYLRSVGFDLQQISILLASLVIAFQRIIPTLSILGATVASISSFQDQSKIFLNKSVLHQSTITPQKKYIHNCVTGTKQEVVSLNELAISRSDKVILNGLNYTFYSNCIYIINAKSGVGKSTLLECITGRIIPSSGSVVWYNKHSFTSKNKLNKSHTLLDIPIIPGTSYIQQRTRLSPGNANRILNMYVPHVESLSPTHLKHIFKACLIDYIDEEKFLSDTFVDFEKEFSGGQIQRLLLAQALISEPSVLLMDESLNGISKYDEVQIIRNIFKLFPNICILSISHRLLLSDLQNNTLFSSHLVDLGQLNDFNLNS